MTNYSTAGVLITADFWVDVFPEWSALKAILDDALTKSKMTVLKQSGFQFEPVGNTHVWILSESHMAVHTYPESGFFAVDIYTCGENAAPRLALDHIQSAVLGSGCCINTIVRGVQNKKGGQRRP